MRLRCGWQDAGRERGRGSRRVREAVASDVGRIAEMVRELATYEKEVDKVESTAESFATLMFPTDGQPRWRTA